MKRKQTFDEKNDLIFVRPKKIIEQVKTFDGETDFIVPRKNTYVDKRNNTIVSLARDNSHSSVDTVGEYANAAAGGGGSQSGCPTYTFNWGAQNMPNSNTQFIVDISNVGGGATQAPYTAYVTYTNSGNSNTVQIPVSNNGIGSTVITGFATSNGGVNGGTYTVSVSLSDANGCMGTPSQISQNIVLQGVTGTSGTGTNVVSGGGAVVGAGAGTPQVTTGTNVVSSGGAVVGAGAGTLQGNQGQQVTAFGTTIIKNIPAVTITNFNASSAVLQPDTISVNLSYQDGKAPYTVSYTITDPNGVVVIAKDNTTTNLQDSLQPPALGLSAGTYTVTVKVTGADNSSDTKIENVYVKGTPTPKFSNLSVSASNPTTSGFDMSTSWSNGVSPYQVNAKIKSGGLTTTYNSPSIPSLSHNWVQSLIIDNSGITVYGSYDIDVEVIDSMGNQLMQSTSIYVSAPKPQPLVGQLYETNKQNASFDVQYKFANGVAPYTLTATLYYPADASGNSQSFPISEANLTNTGVFPINIIPDASGAVLEGYYNLLNCVVTDANGQTANVNDLKVYLNGVKANIAPPPPPPPPTTVVTGGGGFIGGGGGGGVVPAPEVVAIPAKEKTGINWLLIILALGVGYAIIRKKQ